MAAGGRVVLIGETRVGKTSIIERLLKGSCAEEQTSTVGAVFHTHDMEYMGKSVPLQIWDTAGQERYRSLAPMYYRKSSAAIAVFDLTRRETLEALAGWVATFRENADDVFVVVAGNKSDLESQIVFTVEETTEWAAGLGAECIWTSAETGMGVTELFHAVCRHIIESRTVEESVEPAVMEQKPEGKCNC